MRTPKFNDDVCRKVLMYISEGRTVRDACRMVDITEMTLSRWRKRYSKFNIEYKNAVKAQQKGAEVLRKRGVRVYRKNSKNLA